MEKRALKGLGIDIFNLQNKSYDFDFAVDDQFFQSFDDSLIKKGKATIKVTLNKSETFIELAMQINGAVELICDRSVEEFDFPINLKQNLMYKFGEEEKELDDFMIQITKGTMRINLDQHIYEFISLAIPMKKLHPRFAGTEDDNEGDILFYSSDSKVQSPENIEETGQDVEEDIDPRWKKLIDLKNTKR